MYTNAAINIALEGFAAIILASILASMMFDKNRKISLNRHFVRLLLCYLVVLLFDIICWAFDGKPNSQARDILVVSNFCVHAVTVLGANVYNNYIIAYISTKVSISKTPVYAVNMICAVHGLLLIVSQFNHMFYYIDETNYYNRGSLFLVAYSLPAIISVIQIVIVLHYRKELGAGDVLALLSYNALLFIGAALQSAIRASMGIIMVLYVFVTIGLFIVYIRIQVEKAKRLESELTDSRIDIMLSQIQPHFLFNTLATIEAFCYKDGETAARLVRDFSDYLRENMDSLTQKELVHFDREMAHIKIYLDIEKLRFEEQLKIVYDLKVTDFRLPILTVQPLVENAVRYGVNSKLSGGTVMISTEQISSGVKIVVADNGAGFDPEHAMKPDGRSHIGIENVRERIAAQCGGVLTVESFIGKGTVCTMIIPQKEDDKT